MYYLRQVLLAVLFPAIAWGQGVNSTPLGTTGHSTHPIQQTSNISDYGDPNTEHMFLLGNSAGDNEITVTPYGSLWGNMTFATSRTNSGVFTVWVFSEEEQGESAFEIDARRTRVGIDLAGPRSGFLGYQLGGRVEVDFFGQFLTENRAGTRLRHAYFEATREDWRFLVGQTWDVISSLGPGMLNFTNGWAGGNIGFRRAQFRLERTVQFNDRVELLFQGSLNQDIVDDFPADPGVRREPADYPVIEARSAIALEAFGGTGRSATFGVSGHYGETGFDFIQPGPPPLNLPPADDTRFTTWSINFDAELPLTETVTLRGEAFRGANLSPFFGGIGQGVCPCLRKPIRSTGGWLALEHVWSAEWESRYGAGIDDPNDEDSLMGRVQNQFLFANLIWHVTTNLSTGWEVAYWRTLYQDTRAGQVPDFLLMPRSPGEAVTLEWMVRYDF